LISFDLKSKNQILVNPKLSEEERQTILELKEEFEKEFGAYDYILVPSSGSSKKVGQSVKLVALQVARILNSANRVNHFLKSTDQDHWGLVLPEFHVAGIGVLARAYLMQSKVFRFDWSVQNIAGDLEKNKISYLSLVPAQVFDLIQAEVKAPACLKTVFVGGGALTLEQRKQFVELGWPVVETYGMTETCSMIAVRYKDNDLFHLLNNVYVKAENKKLSIRCDSLLTATIQKIDQKIEIKYYDDNSWYESEDQVDLINMNSEVYLRFLGRDQDYFKILGEGVSLSELRSLLSRVVMNYKLPVLSFEIVDLVDARAGTRLFLAVEESVTAELAEKVFQDFNRQCRAYEKIKQVVRVQKIPRTDLGKLKFENLKAIVVELL
jgi:o-succinylbenzoate---CoA ligase